MKGAANTQNFAQVTMPVLQTSRQVSCLVDDFFRHQAGRLVALLTRLFGTEHLNLAEDVVQETLTKALLQWPCRGVPDNPSAWITQVAKNGVLDALRREKRLRTKAAEIVAWAEQTPALDVEAEALRCAEEIQNDLLRMIFTCCHPALSREAQVALTLKTLCGFSVGEIARAFLAPETRVAKWLTRAKWTLRRQHVPFEVPEAEELPARRDAVLQTLYLLFNEGYNVPADNLSDREDLCRQALYLTSLLVAHPTGQVPQAEALMALMLFQASRLPARRDTEGGLSVLSEQDRTQWDWQQIRLGFQHLSRASTGETLSTYHIEAGIAACHAAAPSCETTNWTAIRAGYDDLMALNPSPVVALNRAVAVAMQEGADAGLKALSSLHCHPEMARYYLLPATQAHFAEMQGDRNMARKYYQEALLLAPSEPERRFLQRKIAALS